jgi:hypothetical protein
MIIPTWKVTVYLPIYKHVPGPRKIVTVEAHTGTAAEQLAIEKFPGGRVVRIERLSGYGRTE